METVTPSEGHSQSSGAAAAQLQLMTGAKQNTSVEEFGTLTAGLQSPAQRFLTFQHASQSPGGLVEIDCWAPSPEFLV